MLKDLEKVREIAREQVASGAVTHAITIVGVGDQVRLVDAQGVVDAADPTPIKADAIFWAASMTKPIVAVTAMMALEDGRLALEDEVSKYIPEFAKPRRVRRLAPNSPPIPKFNPGAPVDPDAPKPIYDYEPAKRPLIVRDFITSTAGLQTIGVPNDELPPLTPEYTLEEWVSMLGDAPLDAQPGERWHYSNSTGFDVLARVVEVAFGRNYRQLVQERLFDPVEMVDSSFGVRADLKDRQLPVGHIRPGLAYGKISSGSAGMFTTAKDYHNFGQMLLHEGQSHGRQVMSANSVRLMKTSQIGDLGFPGIDPAQYARFDLPPNPGLTYGYGLAIVRDGPASGLPVPSGSFGWDGVGTRRYWSIPALDAVIVMAVNAPTVDAAAFHRRVEAQVVEALS